jgi:TfoX/Sxy family transcriptional regulator of competence genes
MGFDEGLAERVRGFVVDDPDVSERKMFGGLCFLSSGNMCFGIVGSELMVRVGPEGYKELLSEPNAREMDFTGRAMRGMVYVNEGGISENADLSAWLRRGLDFASSLPAK